MRPIAVLVVFAGSLAFASASAAAQEASFDVSKLGHPVGTASFNFKATADGYDSSSLVRVSMTRLDYASRRRRFLSAADQLHHVQLSAIVNGEAVNVTAAPDDAQLLLNVSAGGHSATTRLDARRRLLFFSRTSTPARLKPCSLSA